MKIKPNKDKIKVGDSFWSVCSGYDDVDNKFYVDLHEWVVRSIRSPNLKKHFFFKHKHPKKVYLIRKTNFTWVKGIGKNKPYGWAKSICEIDRESFRLGDELPRSIFTTPLQSLKSDLKYIEEILKEDIIKIKTKVLSPDHIDEVALDIKENTKLIPIIKSRITKLKNK